MAGRRRASAPLHRPATTFDALEGFDVIVVGAGAAGCVAARRLAESGRQVLLLEAGPEKAPSSVTTVDALSALGEPGWSWPDVIAARETGGSSPYRQGRGLGGGTAVNSLVLNPGDRADYEAWAVEAGCPDWGWTSMEPWFDRVRSVVRPRTATLGPLADALRTAAGSAGHPTGDTSAGIDRSGFLLADLAVEPAPSGDRRRSAADAYLPPGLDAAGNLTVRADTTVGRVVMAGDRAVGVELGDGSVLAGDRIVLAAGALATPSLLWRSGVRHPSLGLTVSDHPSFAFTISLRPSARLPVDVAHPPVSAMLRWSSGSSPRSGNDLAAQVLDHVGSGPDGRRYGAVVVMLGDVRSRGRLELAADERAASSVTAALRFWPGWLAHADDRARMLAGVRHVATLLGDPQLAPVVDQVSLDDRGTPLAALHGMTDRDAERWLVEHPGPVSHVAATLPLAAAADRGVVGSGGAVCGVEGLHVLDASVLPSLPAGNPQLPVMAVAERLSAELAR